MNVKLQTLALSLAGGAVAVLVLLTIPVTLRPDTKLFVLFRPGRCSTLKTMEQLETAARMTRPRH